LLRIKSNITTPQRDERRKAKVMNGIIGILRPFKLLFLITAEQRE
jgi:hypothetical protein